MLGDTQTMGILNCFIGDSSSNTFIRVEAFKNMSSEIKLIWTDPNYLGWPQGNLRRPH
jgi:hypothetical protein